MPSCLRMGRTLGPAVALIPRPQVPIVPAPVIIPIIIPTSSGISTACRGTVLGSPLPTLTGISVKLLVDSSVS